MNSAIVEIIIGTSEFIFYDDIARLKQTLHHIYRGIVFMGTLGIIILKKNHYD